MRFDHDVFSDLHKDAYGFRPRMDLSGYTQEHLDALYEQTSRAAEESLRMEEEYEQVCEIRLAEDIERMQSEYGAPDAATALRWLMEGEDCADDLDHFLYRRGLSLYSTAGRKYSEILSG